MAVVCTIAHVCVVKLPRSSTHVPSRTLRTPSSQPALLDHYPVSPFLDPRSLTSHLMFCNRAISITEPRLWNDLPPELRIISLPPPSSLSITTHHPHPPSLSVTFHSKLKCLLFKHSYPDQSDHSPSPSERHPP